MKTSLSLSIVFVLTCVLFACGQSAQTTEPKPGKVDFSVTISTFNHAERIGHGTLIYKLKDNVLTISKWYMFADSSTVVFTKRIDPDKIALLQEIKTDDLEDFYFNEHVLITSGSEYDVSITRDTITQKIHLHNYYQPQIGKLISEMNKLAPEKYRIPYLKPDNDQ